jgi:beta-glucosidase
VLTPPNGEGNGLQAEYWNNTGFEGEPTISRTERNADLKLGFVNFPGFNASSPKAGQFPAAMNGDISARWTGRITAPKSGSYQLGLTSRGNGRLLLDGEPLVEQTTDSITSKSATVELAAGEPHEVEIEYSAPRIGRYVGAEIRFTWEHADDIVTPAMQRAADLAGRSDAAVVVVRNYETEGDDRPSLDLPNEQAQLIRTVAAANPRTIVVLMSGGPVETASWDSAPHAVLEAWYAGQEQGAAIADVLFGDVNPSGKLPLTFPRSEAETPLRTAEQFPGVEGKVHYTDGVFVGYRGYEELGLDPQYPFGHGLSYTKFRYRKLRVKEARGRKPPRVRFTIRNRGELSGTEVAQVYVGRLPTSVPTPQKALAGFAKAKVRPGRERRVTVKLDPRALSYWDAESDAWVAPKGKVRVFVGSSSRDIRLARKLKLR